MLAMSSSGVPSLQTRMRPHTEPVELERNTAPFFVTTHERVGTAIDKNNGADPQSGHQSGIGFMHNRRTDAVADSKHGNLLMTDFSKPT
jgi:hypothetical protein